jgi:hypothetical protein
MPSPFARNKYNAKKTEYGGVVYDSKSEAMHARRLDLLKQAGDVLWWLRQVPVMIGEPGVDKPYRIDFQVQYRNGEVVGEEIKGVETPKFRRDKKLWRKRGPFPLHVIQGKKVEVIEPEGV